MNDKDLNALIRMAGEAERLEEPAPLRFDWAKTDKASRDDQFRKLLTGIATLAAAACLGITAFVWMKPAPTPIAPSGGGPTAINIETTPKVPAHPAASGVEGAATPTGPMGIASVVLAVFRDADDRCSCIQMNHADFKGNLAEMGSSEIFQTAMANPCHENPKQVTVIAMQGPRESLPTSAAEAEMLAAIVAEGSTICGGESMCISSTASPFVGEGVTVLAGTVGYR